MRRSERTRRRKTFIGYDANDTNAILSDIRSRLQKVENELEMEQKSFEALFSEKVKYKERLLQELESELAREQSEFETRGRE